MSQARALHFPGTWQAFLGASTRVPKDMLTGAAANQQVINLHGEVMYSNWPQVFTTSAWQSTARYLWTFDDRYVEEGRASPDWSDADGWHGANANGTVHQHTCNNWTSSSSSVYGANGEWDFRTLMKQEIHRCNYYLAVACVQVAP